MRICGFFYLLFEDLPSENNCLLSYEKNSFLIAKNLLSSAIHCRVPFNKRRIIF